MKWLFPYDFSPFSEFGNGWLEYLLLGAMGINIGMGQFSAFVNRIPGLSPVKIWPGLIGGTIMSTVNVLEFMHKTAEDIALQKELEALLGVGDGNISSEAELDFAETEALLGDRAPVVTEFAAQNGYQFSVDELVIVINAFQKHHSGELSDEAFAQMLGTSPAQLQGSSVSSLRRLAQFLSKTYLGIDIQK